MTSQGVSEDDESTYRKDQNTLAANPNTKDVEAHPNSTGNVSDDTQPGGAGCSSLSGSGKTDNQLHHKPDKRRLVDKGKDSGSPAIPAVGHPKITYEAAVRKVMDKWVNSQFFTVHFEKGCDVIKLVHKRVCRLRKKSYVSGCKNKETWDQGVLIIAQACA